LASRALWLHRQAFPVETALDRAEAFLQGRRVGGTWNATWETAQILIALLPRHDDVAPFADPLTALRGAQLAILQTGTSCVFSKSWNRRVSKESSAALRVVWVWRKQSVIAVLKAGKSA